MTPTYYAKTEEDAINYLAEQYGECERGFRFGHYEIWHLPDGYYAIYSSTECACGITVGITVYDYKDAEQFGIIVCEECYKHHDFEQI